MERYFEIGRFWGDVAHVMRLTVDELDLYVSETRRIDARESDALAKALRKAH